MTVHLAEAPGVRRAETCDAAGRQSGCCAGGCCAGMRREGRWSRRGTSRTSPGARHVTCPAGCRSRRSVIGLMAPGSARRATGCPPAWARRSARVRCRVARFCLPAQYGPVGSRCFLAFGVIDPSRYYLFEVTEDQRPGRPLHSAQIFQEVRADPDTQRPVDQPHPCHMLSIGHSCGRLEGIPSGRASRSTAWAAI